MDDPGRSGEAGEEGDVGLVPVLPAWGEVAVVSVQGDVRVPLTVPFVQALVEAGKRVGTVGDGDEDELRQDKRKAAHERAKSGPGRGRRDGQRRGVCQGFHHGTPRTGERGSVRSPNVICREHSFDFFAVTGKRCGPGPGRTLAPPGEKSVCV